MQHSNPSKLYIIDVSSFIIKASSKDELSALNDYKKNSFNIKTKSETWYFYLLPQASAFLTYLERYAGKPIIYSNIFGLDAVRKEFNKKLVKALKLKKNNISLVGKNFTREPSDEEHQELYQHYHIPRYPFKLVLSNIASYANANQDEVVVITPEAGLLDKNDLDKLLLIPKPTLDALQNIRNSSAAASDENYKAYVGLNTLYLATGLLKKAVKENPQKRIANPEYFSDVALQHDLIKNGFDSLSVINSKLSMLNTVIKPVTSIVKKHKNKASKISVEQALACSAAQIGCDLVDVSGDGSCFYRALFHQLQIQNLVGIKINYQDYIISNYMFLRHLASVTVQMYYREYFNSDEEFNNYVENILYPKNYADQLEQQALAKVLNINLIVIRHTGINPVIYKLSNTQSTCLIGFEEYDNELKNHYQSLVVKQPDLLDNFLKRLEEETCIESFTEQQRDDLFRIANNKTYNNLLNRFSSFSQSAESLSSSSETDYNNHTTYKI